MKKNENIGSKDLEKVKKCKDTSVFDWLNSPTGFNNEQIKLNEGYFIKCINELIPHRDLITIVNTSKIRISFDTGLVISDEVEVDYPTKILEMSEIHIKCAEDFEKFKRSKYLYIHSLKKEPNLNGFLLRMAEFTQGKRTVSFSIDEETYEKFLSVCDKMAINKSKFIENNIKEFLTKVS